MSGLKIGGPGLCLGGLGSTARLGFQDSGTGVSGRRSSKGNYKEKKSAPLKDDICCGQVVYRLGYTQQDPQNITHFHT